VTHNTLLRSEKTTDRKEPQLFLFENDITPIREPILCHWSYSVAYRSGFNLMSRTALSHHVLSCLNSLFNLS